MSSIIHSNATVGVGQLDVSNQRRLPVDDMVTNNVQSVSAEAIQYYYYASGVLTQDAGQAAGTIVVAKLANTQILNSLGDTVGTYGDTSFSFGTGTVLVSAQQKPFRGVPAELAEVSGLNSTLAASARATAVTQGFLRGDWCIDHEHGVIYGVKATIGTTDTGSYKVNAPGGGGSVAENVNVAKVGGTAVSTGAGASDTGTQRVTIGSTTMQAQGTDATGQDTYATIVTASAARTHVFVTLGGSNNAILSLDGGTTDHFTVPAGSVLFFDSVTVANGANVQAKNATAGSNYTDLAVSIW